MTPIDPQHNRVTIRVNEMEDAIEESPKNYRKDVYAVDGDGQLKYFRTEYDRLKY